MIHPNTAHAGCRTRTEKVCGWTVGHFGELAAVAAPSVLGAATTPWLSVLSAVIAAVWGWHEARLHRSTRTTRASLAAGTPPPRQLSSAPAPAEPGATGRKEAQA
ncbi:hypothetical protein ATK36_0478 [Amycolatopsis sulphurea]|uniref:Uncharacterized protein n=1 Tax=Amycolatopsis sulphurea TaxID=76022 RepID=A0A2A9G252_9PSEU|nr:conjugal transfer protein TraH [Amycolatopsis sulphurea]PFG56942.1 hypothetical protein ATK36_0478 [Amycolatopsis sulphurea]